METKKAAAPTSVRVKRPHMSLSSQGVYQIVRRECREGRQESSSGGRGGHSRVGCSRKKAQNHLADLYAREAIPEGPPSP